MRVFTNSFQIYGPEPILAYDDEDEGGGLRLEIPGLIEKGIFIEINDESDDYGRPTLAIRVSGSGMAQALIVRPQVGNVILIRTENL